jgi:hypothetical protein
MRKSDRLYIRTTPKEKSELENVAEYFGLTVSQLVHTSFHSYIDSRIESARDGLMTRIAPYIKAHWPDGLKPDNAIALVERILGKKEPMSIKSMEGWTNAPPDTFEKFVIGKFLVYERHDGGQRGKYSDN